MRESTLRSLKAKTRLLPANATDEDLEEILTNPIIKDRLTLPEYGEYKREQNRRQKAAKKDEPAFRHILKDDVYECTYDSGTYINVVTGGNNQLTVKSVFNLKGTEQYVKRTTFQERIDNGFAKFLYNKRTGKNVDQYVVHAGDVPVPKRPNDKTKSRLIDEMVTVGRTGTASIGMMAMETRFVWFKLDTGEEIEWTSDSIRFGYAANNFTWGKGDRIQLTGYVRESTGRLFNVRVVA